MTRTCSIVDCTAKHSARGFCKKHHKIWLRDNPQESSTLATAAEVNCQSCGQSFQWNGRGPKPKYCGRQCWPSYALDHMRVIPDKRDCSRCGKTFSRAARGGSRAKFCSDTCARSVKYALRKEKYNERKPTKQCLICRMSLTSRLKSYCDDHQNTRYRQCHACRSEFIGQKSTKYCSNECRGWAWEIVSTETPAQMRRRLRPKNSRKRARLYGVKYEPVVPLKVYKRDGWRCGICRGRVNPKLKYPHPMSASLDHIVPMSRGGDHLYVNVQCAHWECNTRKGWRGSGDQLALVG